MLDCEPDLFQKFLDNTDVGSRKAYYLVEINRAFEPLRLETAGVYPCLGGITDPRVAGDRRGGRLMWWAMTKKELAARDKKQREAIEAWMETTDWPSEVKLAVVELVVGFDKAKFMSMLPSERVLKLMMPSALRIVASKVPPDEQKEALERFCAEAIAEYLADPLKELPRA